MDNRKMSFSDDPALGSPILSGKSAAGFSIGSSLAEILRRLGWRTGVSSQFPVEGVDSKGRRWRLVQSGSNEDRGYYLTVYDGIVALCLSSNEILYQIILYEGYIGKFEAKVGVRSSLEEVRRFGEIFYDEGDEMYYFEGDDYDGIAFAGLPPTYETEREITVGAISVHHWELRFASPTKENIFSTGTPSTV